MYLFVRLVLVSVTLAFVSQQCNSRKTPAGNISVDEVYEIINDSLKVNNYIVLDTRTRMDYIRGHLVSAVWLAQDSIESKWNIINNENRPIIIYGTGKESENAKLYEVLFQRGIANVAVMNGGFAEWVKHGYPAAIQLVRNTTDNVLLKHKNISAIKVYEILKSPYSDYAIIDIRSFPEFTEGHILGAQSIPYEPINEFVVRVEEQNFAKNKPIIIYGNSSSDLTEKAIEVMLRNDFSQVYLLSGGIEEWATSYSIVHN